jgi:hypothetical protein
VQQALQQQQQSLAGAPTAQQPLQQQAAVGGLAAVPLGELGAAGATVPTRAVADAAGLQHHQQPAVHMTVPQLQALMQQQMLARAASAAAVPTQQPNALAAQRH